MRISPNDVRQVVTIAYRRILQAIASQDFGTLIRPRPSPWAGGRFCGHGADRPMGGKSGVASNQFSV